MPFQYPNKWVIDESKSVFHALVNRDIHPSGSCISGSECLDAYAAALIKLLHVLPNMDPPGDGGGARMRDGACPGVCCARNLSEPVACFKWSYVAPPACF